MIELIYTSTTPNSLDKAAVDDILMASQRNNKLNNVIGHLYYDGHRFLQILEGDHETIYSLYDRIETDPRHEKVEFLYEQEIETRSFPDWQMAYANLEAHRLYAPMSDIEIINDNNQSESDSDEGSQDIHFGAALYKMFKDSVVPVSS